LIPPSPAETSGERAHLATLALPATPPDEVFAPLGVSLATAARSPVFSGSASLIGLDDIMVGSAS